MPEWSRILEAVSTSAKRNFLNSRTPISARFSLVYVVLPEFPFRCAFGRMPASREDGGKPDLHNAQIAFGFIWNVSIHSRILAITSDVEVLLHA